MKHFLKAHLGSVAIVALWASIILAGIWIEKRTGTALTLCTFKRLTGIPCAGCGSTRSVLALLNGEVSRAFEFNPLTFIFLTGTPVWLGASWWLSKAGASASAGLTQRRQFVVIVVILVAVAANWVWVLRYQYFGVSSHIDLYGRSAASRTASTISR